MKQKTKNVVSLIELEAGDIDFDDTFNCRQSALEQTELSDDDKALEASMRSRLEAGMPFANHTPVKLRPLGKGRYALIQGFRRVKAALRLGEKTPMVGLDETGKVTLTEAGQYQERIDNLTENLHRRNLLPWEKAEAFSAIRLAHPEKTGVEMAKDSGYDKTYVQLLLRIKKGLHDDLWEAYKKNGEAMNLQELAEVCKLPKEEQAEGWNRKVIQKRGGRPEGATTGSKPPKEGKAAETKHLKAWLKKVEKAEAAGSFDAKFLLGCRVGLEAALGARAFSLSEES